MKARKENKRGVSGETETPFFVYARVIPKKNFGLKQIILGAVRK